MNTERPIPAVAAETERPSLPTAELASGLRLSVIEGSLSAVFANVTMVGGVFVTGYALWLGAKPYQMGFLAGIPLLATAVQVFAAYAAEARGARRPFVAGLSLGAILLWLPIIAIPMLVPQVFRVWTLAALMLIAASLTNAGLPVLLSWLSDLVPADMRGRYLATRTAVMTTVALAGSIVLGIALDHAKKTDWGFAALFGVGIACAVAGNSVLRRIPEPAVAARGALPALREFLLIPLRDRRFRSYLVYAVTWGLAAGIASPFFAVYMLGSTDRHYLGLSYTFVVLMGAIATIVHAGSVKLWGYLADKYGHRPVLILSTMGAGVIPFLYVTMSHQIIWPLVVAQVLGGLTWSGMVLAQFNLLIGVIPRARRSIYLATSASLMGLGAAVAPMVGGMILRAARGIDIPFGPFHFVPIHIVFVLSAIGRMISVLTIRRIPAPREKSARYVIGQLSRGDAVRALINVVLMESRRPREARVRAIHELARLRSPLAVEELVKALDGGDPEVREAAVEALGEIGDRRAVPALIAHAKDWQANLPQRVAQALGRLRSPAAVPVLTQLAAADDRSVRLAAARALAEIPSSSATEAAVRVLRTDPDVGVRVAVADGLARRRQVEIVGDMLDLLPQVTSPIARRQLVGALATLLGEGDLFRPALTAHALDRDATVRRWLPSIERGVRHRRVERGVSQAIYQAVQPVLEQYRGARLAAAVRSVAEAARLLTTQSPARALTGARAATAIRIIKALADRAASITTEEFLLAVFALRRLWLDATSSRPPLEQD